MSLLAPLFLLGAAAVALPVVFHLIRRSSRVQKVFSSLMFLDPSTPRLTRRSRLEHILLLLLRCAVICLLALAFARPFLNRPMPAATSDEPARKIVVLVDTSASMKRAGLWPAAQDRINSILSRSSPADQVAVFTFDRHLKPLVTFNEWNAEVGGNRSALVTSRIAATQPTWAATTLDRAVIRAAELLEESDDTAADFDREIVVITDLQEGSRTSDLQAYDWPDNITVRTERLMPDQPGNASLQWMADGESGEALAVRLRVSNSPDSTIEQFQVGWSTATSDRFSGSPVEIYVPAGQSRVISLPLDTAPGPERVALLTADSQPFDNRVFVVPPTRAELSVLYLGEDQDTDRTQPLFFLQRAFPETARRKIRVVPSKSSEALPIKIAGEATLIVVTDTLRETDALTVRNLMEQGGTVLFAPRNVESAPTLARLVGTGALPMTEFVPPDYALLGQMDFRHPLFAPFADDRYSDFTGIHFWKYRRLDESLLPDARVLARFDNEDPALVEVPVGAGRLLVLTSGWHPADSQLALSSKFVPLLFSMLELSGKAMPPPTRFLIGDTIPIVLGRETSAPATLHLPDGSALALDAKAATTPVATLPGIHTIESSKPPARFVANLDPTESRTLPMPTDELERLGAPIAAASPDPEQTAQRLATLHRTEVESRQKLWRWAIAITLGLLLTETWLAGWTTRRVPTVERASP